MKKTCLLPVIAMLICALGATAQVSLKAAPEHNAKYSMLTFSQHTNLAENTFTAVYDVFLAYYREIRAINSDSSLSPGAAKAKAEQSSAGRNDKLKAILTKAQMDLWFSEVEPDINRQIKAN